MTEQTKNIDFSKRSLERLPWQEYITMPSIRDLNCPEFKTYSRRLIEPGKGRHLELKMEQNRSKRFVGNKKVVEMENFRMLEDKADLLNTTTLKSQMAKIYRHVDLGLKVAESDLDAKRNKLKAVILKEETDLTHEYVDRAQKLAEELLEQKKKKVVEIEMRKKREREEEARLRFEQRDKENSEEYRIEVSKNMKLETAEVQKQQICEKMMQKQREGEWDKFWLDLVRKVDDERRKYEEYEEALRLTKLQEQKEILSKQIVGKKIMQNEIKKVKENENVFLDKLKEQIKEEERIEKEYIRQQKLELKNMSLAQLEENRKLRMERDAFEKAFDDYYCQKVAENIENEKLNRHDTKLENKREADYFREQLKQIQEAKLEEERQFEELRLQEVAKKDAIIHKNQEMMREAKEKLHRETLETRKQQIIHKQHVLEMEKEAEQLTDQWSHIMLEKNKELDKTLENYQKEEEVLQVKDLEGQKGFLKLLKKREIVENEEFMKNQKKDQELKSVSWQRFDNICPGSVHPFTKALLKK
ncbi:cilia- and flagella-associated protein 53 [Halyomorpha halys]|uniref:cilia- and flagella-associated protein 53 n=1 Tax=Halyomorpha halys TaxID=286706 RepID=UPI0006D50C29|nr:trichohyalin [Halyomorpha halys]